MSHQNDGPLRRNWKGSRDLNQISFVAFRSFKFLEAENRRREKRRKGKSVKGAETFRLHLIAKDWFSCNSEKLKKYKK